jgi:pyruvate kinase
MAAMITANNVPVDAIVALTESGSTAQWLSRVRSPVPIIALSPNRASLRRMRLFQHVRPLFFAADRIAGGLVDAALARVVEAGLVAPHRRVVMTLGDEIGIEGGTNTVKLVDTGDAPEESRQATLDDL